jgi:hypothetical protein
MKTLKFISAGLLALAVAGAASAAVVNLHITGSTAFRKALYTSLVAQLGGGGSGTCHVAFVGATNGLLGSNQATFQNSATGDTVYCCMAGSVGGVNWVANQIPAALSLTASTSSAWLSLSGNGTYSVPSVDLSTGGTPVASGSAVFDTAQIADVTMSDSLQSSTPYNYTGVKHLVDNTVGIVTFTFAKGKQDTGITLTQYNAVSNMTPLAFQNLAANGIVPLSMFSGNEADDTVDVILTGRDNDSGTRLGTFAETGLGGPNTSNVQFKMLTSGGVDVGSAAGLVTDHTAIWGPSSDNGYSSGGNVKNTLTSTPTSALDLNGNPFVLVSYVGLGDTPGASQQLNYNGVAYSAAATEAGQYTFWTKEHLMYRSDKINFVSTANKTFADTLAPVISTNAAAAAGLPLAAMNVDRDYEGGVVYHF